MWRQLPAGYLLAMGSWCLALGVLIWVGMALRRTTKTQPHLLRWVHLTLAIVMGLATLTAVELYFALAYDESDSLNMTNVSKRWYLRHVQLNDQGFRDDRPFVPRLPEGQKRVLFLGDSFTFGHGVPRVEDRFGDRIAAALEKAQPGKYSVSNLGVLGRGTKQLVDLLTDVLAAGYQLDVLVYVVSLNDIDDFHDNIDRYVQPMLSHQPQFFLIRDTYFFNLMYYHSRQITLPELRGYDAAVVSWYSGQEWFAMRSKLDELRDLCAAREIDLRIAVFPAVHCLGERYPFQSAHERLVQYCRTNSLKMLDLEPVLALHSDERLTASRFDVHPNVRAHELAAEAMQKELLADLFSGP